MGDNLEKTQIEWHPGFYGAAELELISNREELEFEREYNLSKKPLQMDLLIIKKLADVQIENEIGRIFKRYNVVEYKSPEDSLTIDDYYKTQGYACLYKGLGERVNQIPAEELTVSIFREAYPRELFEALKRSGREVKERFPGIYYISRSGLFDTQVVVTGRLSRKTHSSLRILSRRAEAEDVRAFLAEAERLREPGDRNNADAVLQASVYANKRLYDEIRKESGMCEALRELMKDEFEAAIAEGQEKGMKKGMEEGMAKGMEKGMAKGMEKGTDNAILSSVRNLMDSMKWTAEQAMDAIKVPADEREKYLSKL